MPEFLKIGDKLSGLGLGGQSPESLTVTGYIREPGNRSSRPASPSSEALKAKETVAPDGVKGKAQPEAVKGTAGKNNPN